MAPDANSYFNGFIAGNAAQAEAEYLNDTVNGPYGPGWGKPGRGDPEFTALGCLVNGISDLVWCPYHGTFMNWTVDVVSPSSPFPMDTLRLPYNITPSARMTALKPPTAGDIEAACTIYALYQNNGLGLGTGDSGSASATNGIVFKQYTQYRKMSTMNPSSPNVNALMPLAAPGIYVQSSYQQCVASF